MIWIALIFLCVIALASTSITRLNRRERMGMLALYRILKKKLFLINYNVIFGLFTYGLYCVKFLLYLFLFGIFLFLKHEWMLNFVKCFFCIYWGDNVVDLGTWNQSCIPVVKSHLVIVYSFLMCCWIQFASFWLRIITYMPK